jgi:hypothetical protein
MSPIRPIRRRNRRIAAGAAGVVALGATAALALPTLAQAEDEAPEPAPTAQAAPAAAAPTVEVTPVVAEDPIASAIKTFEAFTPEEQVAFRYMLMSHEEKLAFQWMVATPEQRAAFIAFITPPPPPVVTRATVPTYAPKAAPKQQTQVKVNTPAPKTASPAPKTTASRGGSAPNGFLSCVRNRESRGQYTVVNRSSGAAGAYQFMPTTARNTAMHAGRPDLASRPVTSWSPADQDAMASHLYSWQGGSPWASTQQGC